MGVSFGSSIYNSTSIYESGSGGGGGGEGLPVGEIVEFPTGYTPLEKIVFEGRKAERVSIPFTGYRASFNTTENTFVLTAKVNDITKSCRFILLMPLNPSNQIYFNGFNYCIMESANSFANVFINNQNEFKEKFNISYKYNRTSLNDHIQNISYFTTINSISSFNIGDWNTSTNINSNYMEVYSAKVYDPASNMIFLGVPAFDEANQIDGLLDLITNEFFPHEWNN